MPGSSVRCSATTAKGKPCRRWPVAGETLCATHLGVARKRGHFDEATVDRIESVVRAGSYIETAALAAGVGRSTFYDWWQRGQADGTDPADEPYREFRRRMEQARAEGEAVNVSQIRVAAQKDWRAAAWLLERQSPEQWAAPSTRVTVAKEEKPEPTTDPLEQLDARAAARTDEVAERRAAKAAATGD